MRSDNCSGNSSLSTGVGPARQSETLRKDYAPTRGDGDGCTKSPYATVATGDVLEAKPDDGEAIVRGFAKAMDSFEDTLQVGADAEQYSAPGSRQAKGGGQNADTSASPEPGTTSTLYRPVARGLGLGKQAARGSNEARVSLTGLALCARKPLIAAIARSVPRAQALPPRGGDRRKSVRDNRCSDHGDEEDMAQSGMRRQHQRSVGAAKMVEVQVWNYRTKRALVKHRFGEGSEGSGKEVTKDVATGGGSGGGAEAEGKGGGEDAAIPVAISLHPSGNSIAVGFPHYVSVFFIVGGGGDTGGEDGGGSSVQADVTASTKTLSVSSEFPEAARAVAAADVTPLATLRSDQQEFMTKGMFSVAGDQDSVINYDPVSAVHFSPGGHLLAVITGKVSTDDGRQPCLSHKGCIEVDPPKYGLLHDSLSRRQADTKH